MVAVTQPQQQAARAYALRLVTVQFGGDVHLIFGEAVDLADGERGPPTTTTRTIQAPSATTPIDVTLATDTLTRSDLEVLLRDLEAGNAMWNGAPLRTGRLVRRSKSRGPHARDSARCATSSSASARRCSRTATKARSP